MQHLLFLCTANVCRSPMAAGLARAYLMKAGRTDWEVSSAGVWARDGFEADPVTRRLLAEHGIDIGEHLSQALTPEMVAEASVVLVMALEHKEAVQTSLPEYADKVFLLSELVGPPHDIDDPLDGPIEEYRRTFEEIDDLLKRSLERILDVHYAEDAELPASKPISEMRGRRNWPVVRTIALIWGLALVMLGLLIWQGLRKPTSSFDIGSPVFLQATAEVMAGLPMRAELSILGVVVYVPADSLIEAGTIWLTPREPDLFAEAGPGWRRPRVFNLEFYNLAGSLVAEPSVAAPIEVCFALNEDEWSNYLQSTASHEVHYYDETPDNPTWVSLPTVAKVESQQLCGLAEHLTLFALAVQEEEPRPEPEIRILPPLGPYLP